MNNPNISDQLRFSDAEDRILAQFEGDQDIYDYIQWLTVGADMTVEEYEEEIESLEREIDSLESQLADMEFELDKAEEEIKKFENRQED